MLQGDALERLDSVLAQDFGQLPDLVRLHAELQPDKSALIDPGRSLSYGEFDGLVDRVAAALQREGVRPGDVIAICSANSIDYAATFIGALRCGAAVAPLAPSTTPEGLERMLANCDATVLFADAGGYAPAAAERVAPRLKVVSFDPALEHPCFGDWLAPRGSRPAPVVADPERVFNIIYSSGTTGTPKGIVHTFGLRWVQLCRAARDQYRPDAVTLVSTPLYSNTTLVSFLPSVGGGGTTVLMPRFDPAEFLSLAERHRVTHAMLVPVQYRRLLQQPDFDRYDLSSFRMKFCTSAPFSADLKAEILRRWPGGLIEYYGMTEGGGSCRLAAHEHPDKLHTVGQPMEEHDIRLIDPQGREVAQGEIGEVVGRSRVMMRGYLKQPEKTAEAEWYDGEGNRFIRTGDIGRFDEVGFLILVDRAKDMIISGGFNVYPSDLEALLVRHEAVAEAAVFGVPSERWGETPVAAVVLKAGARVAADELREWTNAQLGKTQRLAAVQIVQALPRNDIGKVSKRDLRTRFANPAVA
jgi:long-chain acyl-CoA synthetase